MATLEELGNAELVGIELGFALGGIELGFELGLELPYLAELDEAISE